MKSSNCAMIELSMRPGLTVFCLLLLVACGSSGGPTLVTTQINPNLPAEQTTPYPPPEVPPPPVLPPPADADAGDAAKD